MSYDSRHLLDRCCDGSLKFLLGLGGWTRHGIERARGVAVVRLGLALAHEARKVDCKGVVDGVLERVVAMLR